MASECALECLGLSENPNFFLCIQTLGTIDNFFFGAGRQGKVGDGPCPSFCLGCCQCKAGTWVQKLTPCGIPSRRMSCNRMTSLRIIFFFLKELTGGKLFGKFAFHRMMFCLKRTNHCK